MFSELTSITQSNHDVKWLKSIEPYFPDLHNSQLEFEHHDDHLPQSTVDTLNTEITSVKHEVCSSDDVPFMTLAKPVLGKGANEDLLPPCINEISQNRDLLPQNSDPLPPQKIEVNECSTG